MLIGDLFERDVKRAIPPVVYFHEQEPKELQREVEEYIITGGHSPGTARATDDGIHEQFVRLLTGMRQAVEQSALENPACWISGFYGSGKSSFAKLLGLSLDGRKLPSGALLKDALIAQDHSQERAQLGIAWERLVQRIKPPRAVVFDVGSQARDNEHIHSVIVRQVQHALGYSRTSHLVAEYERKLELDGHWDAFLDRAKAVHGKSWTELKDTQLVEDYFSAVVHALQPDLYRDPMSWVDSRTGTAFESSRSADEAVLAIQHMVSQRCKGCTLFIVVDEVSQYVHENTDRMLALQSFVSALGQRMKGDAWLLATGQQKLEEATGPASALTKLKDRFPSALRVHLGAANIRDVVHRRLLRKRKTVESDLKELFEEHREDLALHGYHGHEVNGPEFIEFYPMLPGHFDLLLNITSALHLRSTRGQGDSHAIRGLLQLLGDLFREQNLASYEVGRLVTLDLVYDVLHSALASDAQLTLASAFDFATKQDRAECELLKRVVKTVALLEQVQELNVKTSTELVARCLYESLGSGNKQPEVQRAIDRLVGEGFLTYSEKTGYKIESSAGQEWQREREQYSTNAEQRSVQIQERLRFIVDDVPKVEVKDLELPWVVYFSDDYGARDVRLKSDSRHSVIIADLQFTRERGPDHWLSSMDTGPLSQRIVWTMGDPLAVIDSATKLVRSLRMVELYDKRRSSLVDSKLHLLSDERNRSDSLRRELTEAVESAFLSGKLYFRGRAMDPRQYGSTFGAVLTGVGNAVADKLYPHPVSFPVTEKDILYLIDNSELAAPPSVLGPDRLGILSLEAGRYEPSCTGRVPTDVLAFIRANAGVTGSTLLAHFGAPPHGTSQDVIRATVVGLLRARKLRVDLAGEGELTSVRDAGARELLKDGGLRKARFFENTKISIEPRDRNAIGTLFKKAFGADVARTDDAIHDAVVARFGGARDRLTQVEHRFRRLPASTAYPDTLTAFAKSLEDCRRSRNVEETVKAVKRSLPQLSDGFASLERMETELTDSAIDVVRAAEIALSDHWRALEAVGPTAEGRVAADALRAHLRSDRAWADTAELEPAIRRLNDEYRSARQAVLEAHDARLEQAVERIKLREGVDRLNPDQRHLVLRHIKEGAAHNTDERAVEPPLQGLAAVLAERLDKSEARALAQLDELLESIGEKPIKEIALQLSGREIRSTSQLDYALDDLRRRVLIELEAGHRVRLK